MLNRQTAVTEIGFGLWRLDQGRGLQVCRVCRRGCSRSRPLLRYDPAKERWQTAASPDVGAPLTYCYETRVFRHEQSLLRALPEGAETVIGEAGSSAGMLPYSRYSKSTGLTRSLTVVLHPNSFAGIPAPTR